MRRSWLCQIISDWRLILEGIILFTLVGMASLIMGSMIDSMTRLHPAEPARREAGRLVQREFKGEIMPKTKSKRVAKREVLPCKKALEFLGTLEPEQVIGVTEMRFDGIWTTVYYWEQPPTKEGAKP